MEVATCSGYFTKVLNTDFIFKFIWITNLQNYTCFFCSLLTLEKKMREGFKNFINPKEPADGLLAIGSKRSCENQLREKVTHSIGQQSM